jgi:hypothetical protein
MTPNFFHSGWSVLGVPRRKSSLPSALRARRKCATHCRVSVAGWTVKASAATCLRSGGARRSIAGSIAPAMIGQLSLQAESKEGEDDHLSVEPACRDDLISLVAQCEPGEMDSRRWRAPSVGAAGRHARIVGVLSRGKRDNRRGDRGRQGESDQLEGSSHRVLALPRKSERPVELDHHGRDERCADLELDQGVLEERDLPRVAVPVLAVEERGHRPRERDRPESRSAAAPRRRRTHQACTAVGPVDESESVGA